MIKKSRIFILVAFLVLVGGGFFYWYSYLPYKTEKLHEKIRMSCVEEARNGAIYDVSISTEYPNLTTMQQAKEEESRMEVKYQFCLRENGLEK